MSAIIEKMADDLARDAIEAQQALGDDELINRIGNLLASSSTTAEEAFLTAARVRIALQRARTYLEEQIDEAAAKLDAS